MLVMVPKSAFRRGFRFGAPGHVWQTFRGAITCSATRNVRFVPQRASLMTSADTSLVGRRRRADVQIRPGWRTASG